MDVTTIFGLLEKGLRLIPVLIDTGSNVVSLVQRMTAVAEKAKNGEQVDPAEIAALEADLDAKFAEFNAPLPPE